MRAMQRRCELLMALRPGPPAYDEANPDPLRCCERETWSIHDHAIERVSLCTITIRKRVRPGDPCPCHVRPSDAGMRRTTGQSGVSQSRWVGAVPIGRTSTVRTSSTIASTSN